MLPTLPPRGRAAWLLALLAIALLLIFRNAGLYPMIMGDEWTYSSLTRLVPLREATLPSYLYFMLFRASSSCGDGFLECSRIMNTLLFMASAFPLYALTRRVASPVVASLVALAAVLAPVNVYTAYFMPESSYFLGFWLVTWVAFYFHDAPDMRRAALLGGATGLLAMVKVHGLFLLPALACFTVFTHWERRAERGGWLRQAALSLLALVAAMAVVRYGIGYLIAGKAGLSLMGPLYEGQSDYARKPLPQLVTLALGNLRGHVMALALLYALPLAALAGQLGSAAARCASPARTLAVFSLLMLGSLVAMTTLFTAKVSGTGPYETVFRLHMRYYDFALPLLVILAAALLTQDAATAPSRPLRVLWAVGVAVLLAWAWYGLRAEFKPNAVDSAELQGLASSARAYIVITVLAALSLAAWVAAPRQGARLYLIVFVPLYLLCTCGAVASALHLFQQPDRFDKAGVFVQHYLKPEDRDRLAIVSADPGGIYKAKFHMDRASPQVVLLPERTPVPLASLAAGTRWLLLMDDTPLPANALMLARTQEYALVELRTPGSGPYDADFSNSLVNSYLVRARGLSGQESSGRWSDQKEVELEYSRPLPKMLTLTLSGFGFGPNAGQEVIVSVGKTQRRWLLAPTEQTATLQFDNTDDISQIRLTVPQPTSPQQLGQGGDARALGVFLTRVKVGTQDATALQGNDKPAQP